MCSKLKDSILHVIGTRLASLLQSLSCYVASLLVALCHIGDDETFDGKDDDVHAVAKSLNLLNTHCQPHAWRFAIGRFSIEAGKPCMQEASV